MLFAIYCYIELSCSPSPTSQLWKFILVVGSIFFSLKWGERMNLKYVEQFYPLAEGVLAPGRQLFAFGACCNPPQEK